MIITHTPPSNAWLSVLEEVHPEPIRWDIERKRECVEENDLCFWVIDGDNKDLYLGEFLIGWETGNHYAHLLSISSLKKGVGNFMWKYLMTLPSFTDITTFLGEARPGASWHLAQKYGAVKVSNIINHGGTGETYINFIIEIK